MKKLLKLFGLMSLMMAVAFFVSCGNDDPEPDPGPGPNPSNPTITLDKAISLNSSGSYEAAITVICGATDELSNISAIVYNASGSSLLNIAKEDMSVVTASAQKWNVNATFSNMEGIAGIKFTATTKNGGNTTTSFTVSPILATTKVKVKFVTGYEVDFSVAEGKVLDTATWEYGWLNMEVGVAEGNQPQINDAIYITACKNPDGAAETLGEFNKVAAVSPSLLSHRFRIFTYVTNQDYVRGYNGRFKIQYLEDGNKGISTGVGDSTITMQWDIYTDGTDEGNNSWINVEDFDRRNMIISGTCYAELYNFYEVFGTRPPSACSKAKVIIEFSDLQLKTSVNPWWATLYKIALRS